MRRRYFSLPGTGFEGYLVLGVCFVLGFVAVGIPVSRLSAIRGR